jgi:7-carboxy-7-deazaguanine synthase
MKHLQAMQKLFINEIFYSIQGEGFRAGTANIFIRLANCNLECKFCDTEFLSGKEYSIEQLTEFISQYPCKNIIWTGGEPTLQLTADIVAHFKDLKYFQSIETNGSNSVPDGIDFVSCSPKVAEHVLRKKLKFAHELRYVRNATQSLPQPMIIAAHYYLSPVFDGDQLNYDSLNNCINLIKENPSWKLSIQQHKIWKVQ